MQRLHAEGTKRKKKKKPTNCGLEPAPVCPKEANKQFHPSLEGVDALGPA